MAEFIDLTGRRFGRLTVIRRAENYRCRTEYPGGKTVTYSMPRFDCLCDCGKTVTVIGNNLRQGKTRSCGCLLLDMRAEKRRKK